MIFNINTLPPANILKYVWYSDIENKYKNITNNNDNSR